MDHILKSLRHRRANIQARIDDEQGRPVPDSLKLQALKRLKLRFREQIDFIERLNRRGEETSLRIIRRRIPTPVFARPRG